MSIPTYQPRLQVRLFKHIARSDGVSRRYRGSRTVFDLTPVLGESGGVTVHKSIYAPMGTWEVTLTDQGDLQTQDTLYASIEPMDGIEIRMARAPHEHGGEPPVVLRGFVSQVRRREVMTPSGRPQRSVVISGGDYGKAFCVMRLSYRKQYLEGDSTTLARITANLSGTGLEPKPYSPNEFVAECAALVNEWLEGFFARSVGGPSSPAARSIGVDSSVTEGTVSPFGVQPFDRPVWEWMAERLDLDWNEAFVEDRPEGPVLVYRPVPFRDLNGDWIAQGASRVYADTIAVRDDEIVSIEASRSDANVANYYWVDAPVAALSPTTGLVMESLQKKDPTVISKAPNSLSELYGLRMMNRQTMMAQTGLASAFHNLPPDRQKTADDGFAEWMRSRRVTLGALNQDNVAFEDVSLTLRGSERIKPGRYLRVTRGGFAFDCYTHEVVHEFRPYASFVTHVRAIRGTGLAQRSRLQSSPFGAEGRRGAYGD